MDITRENRKQLDQILKSEPVELAYVFGSIITKDVARDSDVDIAVLLANNLTKEKRFQTRLGLATKLARLFKKDVDVVVINDVKSLFFKYVIIKEGRLIYQTEEVSRLDFESNLFGLYFDFQPFLDSYNRHYVEGNL